MKDFDGYESEEGFSCIKLIILASIGTGWSELEFNGRNLQVYSACGGY
jgi:hypothetical protein